MESHVIKQTRWATGSETARIFCLSVPEHHNQKRHAENQRHGAFSSFFGCCLPAISEKIITQRPTYWSQSSGFLGRTGQPHKCLLCYLLCDTRFSRRTRRETAVRDSAQRSDAARPLSESYRTGRRYAVPPAD